ncbi:glycosyltransferase family 4 protein [Alkalimonas amylolytica]|uniref:Glycosyltransferase involved in cell wall bisynthesis n=1 Tax=Alkalimonas amylolytica TaxID=152573 RepID=A0A1H4AYK4_ALKAM|nr:glycosyltransferase family 4 protein [Alkalimonas amylolytica]SEA40877.1 Glycosyltransferase involved in cell wall bisynthesis [Alkalimonas amylolytica]
MQILLISNMGPKPSAPVQGQFIELQRQALPVPTAYHWMRWHNDGLLNRLCKYPVWLLDFVLRFVFCRQRFDILHVHFFYPTIWLAILYKCLRHRSAKIVVTCHGSDIYRYQPPGTLYRWCAGWVDQWLFASEPLKQAFYQQPDSAQVLAAGIAADYGNVNRLDKSEKDIDLLFVGSLNHNKGLDRLEQLLPLLQQHKVCIIGQGLASGKVKQWQQLYPKLMWLPSQNPLQLKNWYQRAKVLLSLSRQESFGLVMTEALACYTPVIATDTDGARAQLRPEFGWVISQQQTEPMLIEQLLRQLKHCWQLAEPDYLRMQQAGFQYAQTQLLPVIASELMSIYQTLYKAKHDLK